MAETDFVLGVQDSSEIDLTRPNQQVKGAGPMDSESLRGAFFHPLVAFNYDAVALGIVGQSRIILPFMCYPCGGIQPETKSGCSLAKIRRADRTDSSSG